MPDTVVLGADPLSIEDVARVARAGAQVRIAGGARSRIADGRARLLELLRAGERIYGVNTGVGGNIGIAIPPERMETMQHNLVRYLGCPTGRPLPGDIVRAATLLRIDSGRVLGTSSACPSQSSSAPSIAAAWMAMRVIDRLHAAAARVGLAGGAQHRARDVPVWLRSPTRIDCLPCPDGAAWPPGDSALPIGAASSSCRPIRIPIVPVPQPAPVITQVDAPAVLYSGGAATITIEGVHFGTLVSGKALCAGQ